jgi:hypothetical protein
MAMMIGITNRAISAAFIMAFPALRRDWLGITCGNEFCLFQS